MNRRMGKKNFLCFTNENLNSEIKTTLIIFYLKDMTKYQPINPNLHE